MILQRIIGLQSQIIDFTNAFSWADIPSGDLDLIEIPRDFKSDGGEGDIVLSTRKSNPGGHLVHVTCSLRL